MIVIKRDGSKEKFSQSKVKRVIQSAFQSCGKKTPKQLVEIILGEVMYCDGDYSYQDDTSIQERKELSVEEIQDIIEKHLVNFDYNVARSFIVYREKHKSLREWVANKQRFINKYKGASNTANATIDDNSNVASKNIGVMNTEIHKEDNIQISRAMVTNKLKELYPNFDSKQYERDLKSHIIYKHDESSFAGVAPYCCSISMYPFLNEGIRGIGGLSAAPKNLDSYCGMFINLIFATSAQFAGAVATSEFLVYFDYFARKEWGDDYYINYEKPYKHTAHGDVTIQKQIHQYFQQVVYSINQPAAARGMQAAFVNFSYFDKSFFDGMFGNFAFPDGTQPTWDSVNWIQKEFMMWFNKERTKCMLTFPVESFALVYQDGKFLDEENAQFVAEEYSRGHSFFTYISDSVDSLSSCCFEGSEFIQIYDKQGKIFNTTLKDFVDYNDDTINPNGNKKMKDKYFIDSYNLNGDKERVEITGSLKKEYTGAMYKIYTDNDNFITVTPDHELMVKELKNGNIISILAKDLVKSPDDYELVVSYMEKCKKIYKIETINVVKEPVYDIELKKNHYFGANNIITHNCRLKNKLQTKEFNFTNGNMGIMTGSKSVITLNLNRIIQNIHRSGKISNDFENWTDNDFEGLKSEFKTILERVYKYHTAYNELLKDMYSANLLPAYKAGFINLNKQYLTIGLNGLNEAAEFLGITLSDNPNYSQFCSELFSFIKECNQEHKTKELSFNTECVPAESLAIKNYNWDKVDGYVVPFDRNLYASYIYLPSDNSTSILEKIRMHGSRFIGEYLDGGSAAHINLSEHPDVIQCRMILEYAAKEGCQYFTFNVPNSECQECGCITKHPISKCPQCGSEKISYYDRIIGYLTKIDNWSDGRQEEQKTRVYHTMGN